MGRELFDELSYVPEGSTNDVYTVDDPASIAPQYDSVSDSCRLADGRLCHELECVDGVVTASTNDWFKLEVEVLEYLDFNRDGYMDVLVLRRLPGSACPQESLVLSRRGDDEPFHAVACVDGWVRVQTGHSISWKYKDDGTVVKTEHVHLDMSTVHLLHR